jgi:hypothetical protein
VVVLDSGGERWQVNQQFISQKGALVVGLADSHPCRERCPTCDSPCFGHSGHTSSATCGRKTVPDLHSDRRHVWGSQADYREVLRANEREARREVRESIQKCAKCVAIVQRLG